MSEQDVEAVCLGESMALVAPDPPEPLCRGVALRLDVAGAESNTAIWLASLGVRAAWRGRIGADPFGDMIEDSLV
ncbi:MAG: PfkB family carbohydrate kinase, partial [Stackebrandtia sp.]